MQLFDLVMHLNGRPYIDVCHRVSSHEDEVVFKELVLGHLSQDITHVFCIICETDNPNFYSTTLKSLLLDEEVDFFAMSI